MSIIESIKNDLLNDNIKLSSIMNKIYININQLNLPEEDKSFILKERIGYLQDDTVIIDRYIFGTIVPNRRNVRLEFDTEDSRMLAHTAILREPISKIENSLDLYSEKSQIRMALEDAIYNYLKERTYPGFNAYLLIHPSSFYDVLTKIRNRLIDIFKDLDNESNDTLEDKGSEDLLEIIQNDENETVEFKQTMSVCIKTNKRNKEVEKSLLKNIVAMSNHKGGLIFVGVSDDKDIIGIDYELNILNKNKDKYTLHFNQIFQSNIGYNYFDLISYEFVNIEGKDIFIIRVKPSKDLIYLNKSLYVKFGSSCKELTDASEIVEFILKRKNKNIKEVKRNAEYNFLKGCYIELSSLKDKSVEFFDYIDQMSAQFSIKKFRLLDNYNKSPGWLEISEGLFPFYEGNSKDVTILSNDELHFKLVKLHQDYKELITCLSMMKRQIDKINNQLINKSDMDKIKDDTTDFNFQIYQAKQKAIEVKKGYYETLDVLNLEMNKGE